MTRMLLAIAVAGVMWAAIPTSSQAAPIAPQPAGVAADHGDLTQVYWRRYHHHYRHRHCWRGRWGRIHCW